MGNLFDSFSVNRIGLDHIELFSRLPPSWCFQTLSNTTDGRYIFARCGFNDGHKNFVRDMVWEGSWSGLETIYKPGSQTPCFPGEEGFLGVNYDRDWQWLEFFYGYGRTTWISGVLLSLARLHLNASFIAVITLFLFLTLDGFMAICVLLLRLIKMSFRGKT